MASSRVGVRIRQRTGWRAGDGLVLGRELTSFVESDGDVARATMDALADPPPAAEMPAQQVKGRDAPVHAFRIDPETGNIDRHLTVELTSGDVTGLFHEKDALWYGLSRLGQARKVRDTDGRFMKAFPTKPDIGGLAVVGRHESAVDVE